MKQFFKFFFASLLAIIIFSVIALLILFGIIGSIASSQSSSSSSSSGGIGDKAVIYIDLSKEINEQAKDNPLAGLSSADDGYSMPGLYDLVSVINYAKGDSSVKGIYLKCNGNPNGFATSEELRNALADFKTSKKFVVAFGDVISQKAYYVANVADRIYCNPQGGLDWKGFSIQYMFFKNALDKLEIEPQVFYAGKFKSATEPFRADKMSDPNRLQSNEMLANLYSSLLLTTSQGRNIDTALLHKYANDYTIRTAQDAVTYKLIDSLIYDDQVKDEMRSRLGLEKKDKINFVSIGRYEASVSYKPGKGSDRIALIYAQGDIVDGKGQDGQIGSDNFRTYLRKARFDDDVKAVVLRVNSGGGSALASENIWREISLTRKEKPVVISFGDYAASGGYYLSCNADSIFAQPNTITGSIGVFSMMPNLSGFFKNKLGVTFDGVKTSPHAGMPNSMQPLSPIEKQYIQSEVDSIYHTFVSRVADGRKLPYNVVDSIAQGRVWTGNRGLELGLVDRIGNTQDAIDCAARMAKVKEYRLREYPEKESFIKRILGNYQKLAKTNSIKEELGEDGYRIYNDLKGMKETMGQTQTRMPFDIIMEP